MFSYKKHYLCTQIVVQIPKTYMKKIALCEFNPTKYGVPTSVDIVDVESFRNYLWEHPVYRTNYYSIYLITRGFEQLEVDGVAKTVKPGMVVCSRPGEMWHWEEQSQQEGVYLYWTDDFLNSFFCDSQFIERFMFFRTNRTTSFLNPDTKLFRRLLALFSQMREEIETELPKKDQHILRAMVYEALMLLERVGYMHGSDEEKTDNDSCYVRDFQRIAGEHYKTEHQVEYYAGRLFITSNYLNKIVKQSLGMSTKQYLSKLLYDESERLLKYTTCSISEIADELNIETVYFVQKFKQKKGITPLQYRKQSEK